MHQLWGGCQLCFSSCLVTMVFQGHSTAQHSTAQQSTAQHSTAQHSTAQHSTAQHSTAQHSTTQHSTAQLSTAADLVPKPGIQQVQHSVLSTADIQVHRHPVFLCFSVEHALRVGGVNEAQVVPTGACPLRHGACFPPCWTTCTTTTTLPSYTRPAKSSLRLNQSWFHCCSQAQPMRQPLLSVQARTAALP